MSRDASHFLLFVDPTTVILETSSQPDIPKHNYPLICRQIIGDCQLSITETQMYLPDFSLGGIVYTYTIGSVA
jgi:hypothetical protein